ncbi:MAG TPA: PPOX class F420-dependent oxidoreductase [Dehalococcoidia bacterium]|nr:PPOX class F420-dependent oxidoreductase [Dehalococcoidia bacterium]
MPVPLPENVKKLFREPNFGHLATLMPDGSPHVSVVWVDIDGDRIIVNTQEGRVKPKNVRHDSRVAISIYEQANPYNSATVRGRVVEVTHEGAEDVIHKLARKYMGQDRYPYLQPGDQRVTFVIQPEHVSSMLRD